MTNLPKVSNYGEYSSNNYGTHTLEVDLGPLTLYYSYSTIVAFRDENGLHCLQNSWSTTTGKHLNWIQPDHAQRLPSDEFENELHASLARHIQ